MKRLIGIIIFLFSIVAYSSSQDLGLSGNLYFALQNWTKVGDGTDPKIGIGLGGTIGIGLNLDSSMTVAVGPHFAYNAWGANYSEKANSYTESVTLNMQDVGLELSLVWDDISIFMGAGESKMEHFMTLTDGQKIPYYGLDGRSANYTTVGFTFAMAPFLIGANVHSYADFAKDVSRIEFRVGLGMKPVSRTNLEVQQ